MLFLREFTVRKHERGLLFKNGDFERFLAPSTYRFFDPRKRVEVERYDLSQPAFEHRLIDFLVRWYPEEIDSMFVKVETGPSQLAVVYENGRPSTVVGPNRRALFWKGVVRVRAETIDLSTNFVIAPQLARAIVRECAERRLSAFEHATLVREVPETHVGLLYVDGRLAGELPPGLHAFWKFNRSLAVDVVDLRVKTLKIDAQEFLTSDKVELRIDVNVSYRLTDARKTVTEVKDPVDSLTKEIQLALRIAVGHRTVDALLQDKSAVDRAVFDQVCGKLAEIGIEVCDLCLRDIVPQHDRLALRLKELEAIERITEKVSDISVVSGLQSVLPELVRIKL